MASRQDSMRGDVSIIMTLPVTGSFYLFYCNPFTKDNVWFLPIIKNYPARQRGKRKTNNRRDFIETERRVTMHSFWSVHHSSPSLNPVHDENSDSPAPGFGTEERKAPLHGHGQTREQWCCRLPLSWFQPWQRQADAGWSVLRYWCIGYPDPAWAGGNSIRQAPLYTHQRAIMDALRFRPDRFFAMSGKPRELEVLDFITGKLSVTSQPVMLPEIKSHCLADNRLPILSFYYRTNYWWMLISELFNLANAKTPPCHSSKNLHSGRYMLPRMESFKWIFMPCSPV